jgi:hypothetical protein
MSAELSKYAVAVHNLLELADWTESLHPGLWIPPNAIQACLPWARSYLRELIEGGRVAESVRKLPGGKVVRMASIHDALAVVERSQARAARSDVRRRRRTAEAAELALLPEFDGS